MAHKKCITKPFIVEKPAIMGENLCDMGKDPY